jgi:hypothetical protein
MSTSCTCCRGRRCVRVRTPDERAFDSALVRLRDKLARERPQPVHEYEPFQPNPLPDDPRPWEMTRRQFEDAAEPKFEPSWGTGALRLTDGPGHRFLGLSRSVLKREIRFMLRCAGGPVEGYGVRIPATRPDLEEQPHRAFVEAALAEGQVVPWMVLREYPDLSSGIAQLAPPRLDVPRGWRRPRG